MNKFSSHLYDFPDISAWLDWSLNHPILSDESQLTFDKYYSSYKNKFPKYVREHYKSQTEEAMSLIEPGVKVLELGCGCGTESLWFALNGAAVVGVDLKSDRLAVAQERRDFINRNITYIDAEFIADDVFNLAPLDDGFDLIWMEQAFHHIEPRANLPEKLHELLKPGGSVVISEANALNPPLQLLLYKKRRFKTIVDYIDEKGVRHLYGNERITTASRISKLFARQGFKTVSSRHFRVLPNFKGVERLSWIEKLTPTWLIPAYTHFNIVLTKLV